MKLLSLQVFLFAALAAASASSLLGAAPLLPEVQAGPAHVNVVKQHYTIQEPVPVNSVTHTAPAVSHLAYAASEPSLAASEPSSAASKLLSTAPIAFPA